MTGRWSSRNTKTLVKQARCLMSVVFVGTEAQKGSVTCPRVQSQKVEAGTGSPATWLYVQAPNLDWATLISKSLSGSES